MSISTHLLCSAVATEQLHQSSWRLIALLKVSLRLVIEGIEGINLSISMSIFSSLAASLSLINMLLLDENTH